jgi:hypothetical protein
MSTILTANHHADVTDELAAGATCLGHRVPTFQGTAGSGSRRPP